MIKGIISKLGREVKCLGDDEYIAVYGQRDFICGLFTALLITGYELGYCNIDMLDDFLQDMPYMLFVRGNGVISVEDAISSNDIVVKHDAKVCYLDVECDSQEIFDYCMNSGKITEILFPES